MGDAIAEVQAESIEAARARAMPCDLAQWKALAARVGAHWAFDRLREAKVRSKYDAVRTTPGGRKSSSPVRRNRALAA
jgi:hypothetical protein